MPLARLEIEQVEGNRWVAEVEAGGFVGQRNFRHVRLNATSYEGIMSEVSAFYYRQVPPVVPSVAPDDDEPLPAVADAKEPEDAPAAPAGAPEEVEVEEPAPARTDVAEPGDDERAHLRAEAEDLGIEYDRRWGVTRLREEIAKAKESVR